MVVQRISPAATAGISFPELLNRVPPQLKITDPLSSLILPAEDADRRAVGEPGPGAPEHAAAGGLAVCRPVHGPEAGPAGGPAAQPGAAAARRQAGLHVDDGRAELRGAQGHVAVQQAPEQGRREQQRAARLPGSVRLQRLGRLSQQLAGHRLSGYVHPFCLF